MSIVIKAKQLSTKQHLLNLAWKYSELEGYIQGIKGAIYRLEMKNK